MRSPFCSSLFVSQHARENRPTHKAHSTLRQRPLLSPTTTRCARPSASPMRKSASVRRCGPSTASITRRAATFSTSFTGEGPSAEVSGTIQLVCEGQDSDGRLGGCCCKLPPASCGTFVLSPCTLRRKCTHSTPFVCSIIVSRCPSSPLTICSKCYNVALWASLLLFPAQPRPCSKCYNVALWASPLLSPAQPWPMFSCLSRPRPRTVRVLSQGGPRRPESDCKVAKGTICQRPLAISADFRLTLSATY